MCLGSMQPRSSVRLACSDQHHFFEAQLRDSPTQSIAQSIVRGLHERIRRGIMDGLRSFIAVDNCSAVDVRGFYRDTVSLVVQKPQFSEAFPGWFIITRCGRVTVTS